MASAMSRSERVSHSFQCRLPDQFDAGQFDAVIHINRTKAPIPFERTRGWETGKLPETYPYAV